MWQRDRITVTAKVSRHDGATSSVRARQLRVSGARGKIAWQRHTYVGCVTSPPQLAVFAEGGRR